MIVTYVDEVSGERIRCNPDSVSGRSMPERFKREQPETEEKAPATPSDKAPKPTRPSRPNRRQAPADDGPPAAEAPEGDGTGSE